MDKLRETAEEKRKRERRENDRRMDLEAAMDWPGPERRMEERRSCERRRPSLPEGLYLIDLPQSMPGFKEFISSWFFVDALGRRIVVDPGPASTIPFLIDVLSGLTDGVDLVLLTHIHLDHSGGVGQFCRHYAEAKVVAHPKAARHLQDPTRLWKASLETLGDVARMYGEPEPLSADAMTTAEAQGIESLVTPGHASHHISFRVSLGGEKLFFIGEAAGLTLPAGDGPEWPYLRPTTPPKFDARAALSSLEAIDRFLVGDELLCYAHWGTAREAKKRVALAKTQLGKWLSTIETMRVAPVTEIFDHLLECDPLLGEYPHLPEDLRQRERLFILNSIKGLLGSLEDGR